MAITAVTEPPDGSPDGVENEADWDATSDEPEQQDDKSKPKPHNFDNFIGLILGPARGSTETGAQQHVVGASAAQRWTHVHNQLDFLSKGGWSLPTDLRAQLRYDPFIADNLCKSDTYGKSEFKSVQQTKLISTSECYGLEVLVSVNTSVSGTRRDDGVSKGTSNETRSHIRVLWPGGPGNRQHQ